MGLVRFLSGYPGNFKEFVSMAKERNLPVIVLFNVKREKNFANSNGIIRGEVVYFAGTFEQAISDEGIKFAEWWGMPESKDSDFSRDGILGYLQKQSSKNLDYLVEEKIDYSVKILNQLG